MSNANTQSPLPTTEHHPLLDGELLDALREHAIMADDPGLSLRVLYAQKLMANEPSLQRTAVVLCDLLEQLTRLANDILADISRNGGPASILLRSEQLEETFDLARQVAFILNSEALPANGEQAEVAQ
jgi:hypothetical protein